MIAATLATVPDARVFKRARDFVAWIGLTPRQFGSGGKVRSGGISKQGDRSLRTLYIVGACAHLRQEIRRGVADPWLARLVAERPFKVAALLFPFVGESGLPLRRLVVPVRGASVPPAEGTVRRSA